MESVAGAEKSSFTFAANGCVRFFAQDLASAGGASWTSTGVSGRQSRGSIAGKGWNSTAAGCIFFMCAHDMFTAP